MFSSRHSLSPVPLRVVVPLCHTSLTVDVGQPHLPLLVQLAVEGDGVFEVVLVPGVVEKAETIERNKVNIMVPIILLKHKWYSTHSYFPKHC
jgi:hypothetical protein